MSGTVGGVGGCRRCRGMSAIIVISPKLFASEVSELLSRLLGNTRPSRPYYPPPTIRRPDESTKKNFRFWSPCRVLRDDLRIVPVTFSGRFDLKRYLPVNRPADSEMG